MSGQCVLAVKTSEDAERVDALAGTTGDRNVTFTQTQHLSPLDDARVSGRTGGADRVVRPCDAQVQRDLTGRVVRDRTRIVVVRPTTRVVIKSLDHEDFVFGFDVAVLGDADVDADA